MGCWEGGDEWKYLICYLDQHDLSVFLDSKEQNWQKWVSSSFQWTCAIDHSRGGQLVGTDSFALFLGMWNAYHLSQGCSEDIVQVHFFSCPVSILLIPRRAKRRRRCLLDVGLPVVLVELCLDYLYGLPDQTRQADGWDWTQWPLADSDQKNLFDLYSFDVNVI